MQIDTIGDANLVLEAAAKVYRKRARLMNLDELEAKLGKSDAAAIRSSMIRLVDEFFVPPLHEEEPADLLREIEALKGESSE